MNPGATNMKQMISRENSMLIPDTTRETVNVTRVTAIKKGIIGLNHPVQAGTRKFLDL